MKELGQSGHDAQLWMCLVMEVKSVLQQTVLYRSLECSVHESKRTECGRAGDGEKKHQWNAEFQRIARREKKDFFNEQCIIIDGNNKRAKTRDLIRKIRNIKGAFCPKMGTIMDRDGRDLVDAEEIKKRWKGYMEELYKTDLHELDYYSGEVNHPEPDILERIQGALRSAAVNEAMDVMRFQKDCSDP